jgi:hypothetical protein
VITLTASPAIAAYVAGQTFRFIASGANTTNVTVAINGLAAKAITKNGTTALAAGDIAAASMVSITYDGTRFILGTHLTADIATLTGTQTLTNKTLTAPAISAPVLSGSATGTYTLAGTPTITAPTITGLGAGAMTLIQSQTASASATIDFTTGITSTYDHYLITITNLVNATSGSDLYLRVSQDGGSTFKAGGTDYAHARWAWDTGAASAAAGSVGTTAYLIASIIRNTVATTDTLNGEIRCFAPSGTAISKQFSGSVTYISTTPAYAKTESMGAFILNQAAYNGIRLLMSAGNITSGTFTLYGIRKA